MVGSDTCMYVCLCIKETGCDSPKGFFHGGGVAGFYPLMWHPRNKNTVAKRVKNAFEKLISDPEESPEGTPEPTVET